MRLLQRVCSADRDRLLEGWGGTPAGAPEKIASSLGLEIRTEDIETREGALDLARGAILVNRRLAKLCDPRTDLWGLRNCIVAHEPGHIRLHRALLLGGSSLRLVEEHEAFVYAEEFLMSREMLRSDQSVIELCRWRVKPRPLAQEKLWYLVDDLATRFRVSRSAVVERLVRLGVLERNGKRVVLCLPRPERVENPNGLRLVARA